MQHYDMGAGQLVIGATPGAGEEARPQARCPYPQAHPKCGKPNPYAKLPITDGDVAGVRNFACEKMAGHDGDLSSDKKHRQTFTFTGRLGWVAEWG